MTIATLPAAGTRTGTSAAPGLLAAFVAALLAVALGQVVPTLSPLLVAIVLGVAWRNLVGQPASWAPGVAVAGRRVLRIGIVLLGLQVPLGDVAGLGAGTLLLAVTAVGVTFVGTRLMGRRLGLSRDQSTLIAAGFSICGAAAVVAVEPVTDAEEDETATAVALVVLFGTLMIPLLPLAVAALRLGAEGGGIWVGAATHEVAQVVAAAGLIGAQALPVAVAVKLARVLCLAPVAAILAVGRRRAAAGSGTTLPPIVPLFIAGFVAAMLVRSTGLLPDGVLGAAATAQQVLLAAAMFALGLGVHVRSVLRVGAKPFVLAATATGLITTISLVGAAALS